MNRVVLSIVVASLCGCGATNAELMKKHVIELNSQLTNLRKSQAGMAVTLEDLETRLFLVQDELDTHRKRQAITQRQLYNLPVVRVRPQHGPESNFDSSPIVVPARNPEFAGVFKEARPLETNLRQRLPLLKTQHDAVKLYKKSFEHLKQQRYQQAIDGFLAFVEKHPNHSYADNAVYWMAECYYDRALWLKALTTFQKVIQSYPMGNKAPDAMLKIGLTHVRLKNLRQAGEVLQQVTEIYPRSPVARLAAAKLKDLQ